LVYIEKVRQATKRLSARETNPEDVRGALDGVRAVAGFNVEVPIHSARREVALVKTGVKRLSAWYLGYLAAQLNVFAASVVRLGDALAARTDRLELASDELGARLGAVEERLGRLDGHRGKAVSSDDVGAADELGQDNGGARPSAGPTGKTADKQAPRSLRKDGRRED
jgi:hypothetical protein